MHLGGNRRLVPLSFFCSQGGRCGEMFSLLRRVSRWEPNKITGKPGSLFVSRTGFIT